MEALDKSIYKTLRDDFLLAAHGLVLYPEGTQDYFRSQDMAASTYRTAFDLFGEDMAEALKEEAFKKWPQLRK